MVIDKKKLNRQLIGVDKYFNSGKYSLSFKDCVGCLNYFTGVGKSYTAILIIKEYFKVGNKTITILVPNEPLLNQWQKLLSKNFLKKELDFIKVYTADYLIRNETIINTGVLIVDELDAFYSEKRVKLLDKTYIRYEDILALTATYKDYRGRHKQIEDFIPIIDKIDEEEALAKGYISKYIEYNLGLTLNKDEKEAYNKYSDIIRKNMAKFGRNGLDLAFKCLSGGKHSNGDHYTSNQFCKGWAMHNGWREGMNTNKEPGKTVNYLWNPKAIFRYSLNLIKAIKDRKELLYNNSSKLEAAKQILDAFEDTKAIVFSQSTVFADSLYSIINQFKPNNSVLYHSKVKTQLYPSITTGKMIKHGKVRQKKRAIHLIKEGIAKHLITSSVLDKGLDIPSLKLGLSTSGTQNPTQHEQRSGRVKRINPFEKDAVSIIVNLYIKDSKDEDWLENRQSNSTNIIYWIEDYREISYKPIDKDEIQKEQL